jgi:hypothetical protein
MNAISQSQRRQGVIDDVKDDVKDDVIDDNSLLLSMAYRAFPQGK